MKEPRPYKRTLFDRHGVDAEHYVRSSIFAGLVFVITVGLLLLATGSWLISSGAAMVTTPASWLFMMGLAGSAGAVWNRLMVTGASTPAVEQFSYQQALVMQGRVDEALESFEAVIADQPEQVAARMRAAELYLRDGRNVQRAIDLLKQAQRVPTISAGEDIYVSNRLADLFVSPLNKPGAALAELRRLVDRYPALPAASLARDAIARIKSTLLQSQEISS